MEGLRIARHRGRQARVALSLRSELLRSSGFRHGFSLRHGGVSSAPFESLNLGRSVGDHPDNVAENHRRFAAELGYEPDGLYEVSQVHGARVEIVDPSLSSESFRAREADALLSLSRGCAVAIRVADCVPVLLADPRSGAVAAVHAGWRGIVADVIGAAVAALAERASAAPPTLIAALFPAIGVDAFEVGEEVAEQIVLSVHEAAVRRAAEPRPHVDLVLAARHALQLAGLSPEHIDQVSGCTFSDAARFFSFRRDRGVTGRHLAAIVPRC
jgi:YfiH family protein